MGSERRVKDLAGARLRLQGRIGYRFSDQSLLDAALTHASALAEPGPRRMEQLEFLGDAVLGLVLGDLLLRQHPEATEGELSQYRAALANTQSLARKARWLGLQSALCLGRGEEKSGGREKESILAAAYEAVLGAIYLDGGCEAARACVASHFDVELRQRPRRARFDPKTALQELCQQRFGSLPRYVTVEQSGPDHARRFVVEVTLGERTLGRGSGRSKREAQREAARVALAGPKTENLAL